MLQFMCCFDSVVMTMSLMLLQFCIGCAYQNGSTFNHGSLCAAPLAPRYLNQLARVADLPGRYKFRSPSSHLLHVPSFRLSAAGPRSFPVTPSILRNSLTLDIQSTPFIPVFCQRLKHSSSINHFPTPYCDNPVFSYCSTPLWTINY